MDHIIAIILGIVQGLTEFLPVSSSGHIEIARFLFNDHSIGEQGLLMTVTLHFGTALATIIFFKDDIKEILSNLFSGQRESVQFSLNIILSMIPAAMIGILFEEEIESLFNKNILLVGSMLIITGILLLLADKAKTSKQGVSSSNAIIIGIAQAIAILPGISRSGATIATSTLLGIDRDKAARFSFLMVVPLIFGKMAKDLISGDISLQGVQTTPLLLGFIASLITGYFACKWMITLVKKAQLKYFAYYCFIIGGISAIYFSL